MATDSNPPPSPLAVPPVPVAPPPADVPVPPVPVAPPPADVPVVPPPTIPEIFGTVAGFTTDGTSSNMTTGTSNLPDPQDTQLPVAAAITLDTRIKLSALDDSLYTAGQNFNAGSPTSLLLPLASTGGMLFPYTPQIQFAQAVQYMDLQLVHSITDYAAYTRTPSVTITLTGKFTVQSQQEGRYALACIHFLRAASKMYFGEQSKPKAGLPPPILVLNGYGKYMFNKLRVILKNHSWAFNEDMDTIPILIGGAVVARLPPLFSITCELMVVQTPQRVRTVFNFDKFASGQLMTESEGWI